MYSFWVFSACSPSVTRISRIRGCILNDRNHSVSAGLHNRGMKLSLHTYGISMCTSINLGWPTFEKAHPARKKSTGFFHLIPTWKKTTKKPTSWFTYFSSKLTVKILFCWPNITRMPCKYDKMLSHNTSISQVHQSKSRSSDRKRQFIEFKSCSTTTAFLWWCKFWPQVKKPEKPSPVGFFKRWGWRAHHMR